ncbi:MAG: hypothetical protein MUF49_20345 [Oculatellaceae cyanobacterium Prado106]|jgi:hypothetical protein|nr:hypothetical protein [Oculatellaceae cyanobacterium Prado106]
MFADWQKRQAESGREVVDLSAPQANIPGMDLDQLRRYVLTHRGDDDAFHAYVDRSKAAGRMITIDPSDPKWEEALDARIRQASGESESFS